MKDKLDERFLDTEKENGFLKEKLGLICINPKEALHEWTKPNKLVEKCLLTDEEFVVAFRKMEEEGIIVNMPWMWGKRTAKTQLTKAIPIILEEIKRELAEKCTAAFNTGLDMGRRAEREEIKRELMAIDCMENYADMSKAVTSLVYELKEMSGIHSGGVGLKVDDDL